MVQMIQCANYLKESPKMRREEPWNGIVHGTLKQTEVYQPESPIDYPLVEEEKLQTAR